eukprot:366395-Chlamydomonas_euryale.AAC.2
MMQPELRSRSWGAAIGHCAPAEGQGTPTEGQVKRGRAHPQRGSSATDRSTSIEASQPPLIPLAASGRVTVLSLFTSLPPSAPAFLSTLCPPSALSSEVDPLVL